MTRACVALVALVSLAGGGWAEPPAEREIVYQVSTIGALLKGLFDGTTTVRQLRAHGDFGLGTFDALDGEMLADGGIFYQIGADGACQVMPRTARSPFAAVTFFEADSTLPLRDLVVPAGLDAALQPTLSGVNLPQAIRIEGEFAYVRARSVPRQTRPYPPLTDVVKTQPVFEYRDVRGTLVGFRLPPFVEGLNVPGYHFHFVDAAHRVGGHLLECQLRTGTAEIDVTPSIQVALPTSPEFCSLDLAIHSEADVQRVEK